MFGFNLFNKKSKENIPPPVDLAQRAGKFKPRSKQEKAGASLKFDDNGSGFMGDYGYYERITLYRFLRDRIPVINGAVWTWTRLCSSPIEFYLPAGDNEKKQAELDNAVAALDRALVPDDYQKSGGLGRLSDLFFNSLFTDGAFAGEIEYENGTGVSRFVPVDVRDLTFDKDDSGLTG